jgi:class 3 adenylate cyclase
VTVGYIDGSALAASVSPGPVGNRVAAVWSSFDAACTSQLTEVEVLSLIGRQLDRIAWVWAINSLSVVTLSDEIQRRAVDLAWLGAPPNIAFHVAAAATMEADHFVTVDEISSAWAQMNGLNVVEL